MPVASLVAEACTQKPSRSAAILQETLQKPLPTTSVDPNTMRYEYTVERSFDGRQHVRRRQKSSRSRKNSLSQPQQHQPRTPRAVSPLRSPVHVVEASPGMNLHPAPYTLDPMSTYATSPVAYAQSYYQSPSLFPQDQDYSLHYQYYTDPMYCSDMSYIPFPPTPPDSPIAVEVPRKSHRKHHTKTHERRSHPVSFTESPRKESRHGSSHHRTALLEENDRLRTQISGLANDIRTLRAQHRHSDGEIRRYRRDVIPKLEDQLAALNRINSNMRHANESAEHVSKTLRRAVDKARDDLNAADRKVRGFKHRLDEERRAHKHSEAKAARLRGRVMESERKREDLEDKQSRAEAHIMELKQTIETRDATIRELENRINIYEPILRREGFIRD